MGDRPKQCWSFRNHKNWNYTSNPFWFLMTHSCLYSQMFKCLETFYLHQLFFATMVAQNEPVFLHCFWKKTTENYYFENYYFICFFFAHSQIKLDILYLNNDPNNISQKTKTERKINFSFWQHKHYYYFLLLEEEGEEMI